MSTEAKCRDCGKHIGDIGGLFALTQLLVACQVDDRKLTFAVDCPHCGKHNHLTIEYR
jgi:hypothetical protein